MTKLQFKKPVKANKKKVETLSVFYLIDSSGSMAGHEDKVVGLLNDQIKSLKEKDGVETKVTIATFSGSFSTGLGYLCNRIPADKLEEIDQDSFRPAGGTPLNDSIDEAISTLDATNESSYLLLVVTDGDENTSTRCSSEGIKSQISKLKSTDKWTFAVACPKASVNKISEMYDIPTGCITAWTQTVESVKTLSQNITRGTRSLRSAIATGASYSVTNTGYFAPNLDVSKTEVKDELDNVTSKFLNVLVKDSRNKDDLIASYFVTKQKMTFKVGMLYYELVKPEKVQDFKNIIIKDLATGRLYSGSIEKVREVLNLPEGDFKIAPTCSSKYKIFIRSTSWNRKLVPNTEILLAR